MAGGLHCELAHKGRHADIPSETQSQSEQKGFSGFCQNSSALARGCGCLACGYGYLARGLAIAGEKWYGFSKSGTAFWKVVPLFCVSAIAVVGLAYPATR